MARSLVRTLAVVLSLFVAGLAVAVHAEVPKAQGSPVTMEWLGWNAWRVTSPEGKVLLFNPFVSNPEAARTGKQPTYRIADLSNPNIKQWAKDIMKKDNDEVLAGKIAYTPGQSCKPSGVPYFMLAGGPLFFVQTPKEVLLITEGERSARRIYLNVPHSASVRPSWYGESVGKYEGDTLVVDTIGQTSKTFIDNYRTPHSEKLHVVERFRLIDEGKTLEVQISVDDPDTYNQPWKAVRRFNRTQATLGEEICQEGNFLLFDYGIPIDDKPDF